MSIWSLIVRYSPFLAFWFVLNAYVGWRLIAPLRLRRPLELAVWGAGVVATSLPLLTLLSRAGVDSPRWVSWIGYVGMGFASILILFALVRDVVLLKTGVWRWLRRRLRADAARPTPQDPERRAFLTNAVNLGIVGSASVMTTAGTVGIQRVPEVNEVEVPIEGLHPGLEGFRIAQLTDIHVGPTIKGDYLRGLVDAVNELDPDLIAVTGDLIDGRVPQLREHVAPLADLRARHGAFFVTGNHEYYWGAEDWIAEVRRLGLRVLLNEHDLIEHRGARVAVAGVTDHRAARHLASHASDPAAAIADAPTDSFRLLLAHQPRSIYAAERAGFDLQVSGHTHGGQYFPYSVLVYLTQPYVAGLGRAGRTWIYVSRGSGYWGPPLRLGAPAEITLLRLVTARRT